MDTLDGWLTRLGSAEPTPGGGGAAAMTAAIAAGLVEMVANLTTGRARYADHEADTVRILSRAGELRGEALALIAADAAAFTELMAAYQLPRDERRAEAVTVATAGAAGPPLRVAMVAAEVARLAAELPGRSNRNVASDVAVAASTAAAAIESAAINVEINLSGLPAGPHRGELARQLAAATDALIPARELAARLRSELAA